MNRMMYIVALLALAACHATADGPNKDAVRSVADFYSAKSPTYGIQEAIEALPKEGGTVVVPPGVYLLKRSVRVPGNVTLRGSGANSILQKCPEVQTKIAEAAAKGSRRMKVLDAAAFGVGMQICVTSKGLGGWYCSQPVITKIEGNVLELSEPLEKDYDAATSNVLNYFPAIWIERQKNVTLEDIAFDGDIKRNPGPFTDFVCAAIHCVASESVRIRDCAVRDWPCDGIGVQGGSNVFVTGCEVSGCRGHGFHPGTSLHHGTFSDLISHHNAWDGLYFCMNVRYINVTNSVFYENGHHGIGGIGGGKMEGRDQYNVVSGNTCESNAMCGIQVIQGNHNVVSNNVCRNNSQSKAGAYPGILVMESEDIIVTGNLCTDEREGDAKTQGHGIVEEKNSNQNIITSNNCRGNRTGGVTTVGRSTVKANNLE
ncbi:MAG: right-handed parallel beta-helix repeat-containing protein [Planctomycetota bacterium]